MTLEPEYPKATRAAELYRKASDNLDALGCNNLGLMYQYGQGVSKDKERAAELVQKACSGGEQQSCRQLEQLLMPFPTSDG